MPRIPTNAPPIPNPPTAEGEAIDDRSEAARRREERQRGWRRHWPLPVSLALAIVYWIYLNERVSREERPSLAVHFIAPDDPMPERGLIIRTPSSDLTVTEMRTASNKIFDYAHATVLVSVTAPGAYLRTIEDLRLIVDVKPQQVVGDLSTSVFEWKFTRKDLRDPAGVLTHYIDKMEPSELTLVLERSASMNLTLTHENTLLQTPTDGAWDNRLFRDSLRFQPPNVVLSGPQAQLDAIRKQPQVFVMDLTKALEELVSTAPDQREPVSVELRLKEALEKKGVVTSRLPTATIYVAPEPALFKGLAVKVWPDWTGSPLARTDFRIDKTVQVDVRSYDPELSRLLRNPQTASKWVADNVRCIVRLQRIDANLDPTKPDFVAHLEPHFFLYERLYRDGRDLRIQPVSLVSITRKSP